MHRHSSADVMKIIMEDHTGRKHSSFRISTQDKKAMASIFKALNDEYGLGLEIHERGYDYDTAYKM